MRQAFLELFTHSEGTQEWVGVDVITWLCITHDCLHSLLSRTVWHLLDFMHSWTLSLHVLARSLARPLAHSLSLSSCVSVKFLSLCVHMCVYVCVTFLCVCVCVCAHVCGSQMSFSVCVSVCVCTCVWESDVLLYLVLPYSLNLELG